MTTIFGIRCVGSSDEPIRMPEGCERVGAVRHAIEHAGETGLIVEVLVDDGWSNGWRQLQLVDPAKFKPDALLAENLRLRAELRHLRDALARAELGPQR